MNNVWFSSLRRLALVAALATTLHPSLHAQAPATTLVKDTALALDSAGWPAADAAAGVTWEGQGSDRFLSLTSPAPGALVSIPRELVVPAGTEALELSWRQRISDLKPGSQNGDARLVFEFFGADKARLPTTPPYSFYRDNSAGWEPKVGRIPVPAGARTFRLTPALVRVESGRYDIDDITVTPVARTAALVESSATPVARSGQKAPRITLPEKGPLPDETEQKQYWPPELKVSGNRLVTVNGGREVWLQGVNVASLEWSIRGESVDRSIVTAIQDWNANAIRLPVKGAHWFGKGEKHNTQKDGGESYRATVDKAIMLAANRGAYVVLDLHHYRAPRKEDLDFWTDAATRYKNHPAVLFDLLNEPHGTTWEVWKDGGFIEEKKKAGDEDAFLSADEKLHNKRGFVSPGMQKMLDTVRATGARNIAVVGGLDYAYNLTGILEGHALKDSANGHGIMYSTHVYPWKKGWQKRFLDVAAKHPILVGEVGGDAKKMTWLPANHQENVETWAPAMIGIIQKHRLNWTAWCFHPKASPRMLLDWNYTPTPFWGQLVKEAFNGKQFPEPEKLR